MSCQFDSSIYLQVEKKENKFFYKKKYLIFLLNRINKVSVENWNKFNLHHGSVTHIVLDRNGEIFCADFNNAMFIPEEKRTYN